MRCFILLCFIITMTTAVSEHGNEDRVVKQSSDGNVDVGNLQLICLAFNISLENCTCEQFKSKDEGDIGQSICKSVDEYETPVRKLIYIPEMSIPIGIIACLFSVLGIIGNSAVVKVTRGKTDAVNFYLLICLLAVSDLLFSAMQLILSVPLFWTNEWLYGNLLCKCFRGGKAAGDFLYIGFVILLAFERYFVVVKSTKKIDRTKIYVGVVINIVVSLTTALPIFIIYELDDLGRCEENWGNGATDSMVYNWFLLAIYMVLPACILAIVSTKIYEKVKLHATINHLDVTQLHTSTERKARENQRTMKIIVAMAVAYILCNLPNRIAWIYLGSKNYEIDAHSYKVIVFISMVTYPLLVCVNPFIYSIIDSIWRRDIKNVLCCQKEMKRPDNENGFTVKNKSFDAITADNLNTRKPERSRNLSIDQGTHLLSYNSFYFTMPNKKADLDNA